MKAVVARLRIEAMLRSVLPVVLSSMFLLWTGDFGKAAEGAPPPSPHLFLLSGQSNMTGTLAGSFRACVEQVMGKENVLVSMTGRPGQPIKQWVKNWQPPAGMEDPNPKANGALYELLIAQARKTLQDRKPASVTLVWMQGEQDANSSWASVYEKSFLSLLDQIKTDLDLTTIHFVVGRINDFWLEKPDGKAIREILVKLGDEHKNGAWIDTDDLNRGVNPWGGFSFEDGHYPPQGYVVMGRRFAKEAIRLLGKDAGLDHPVFKEHFIDSHRQIRSHAATGKAVSGPQGALAVLTDGGFGGSDHKDPAWGELAPSEAPIEITVDLGEPMIVRELGINLLLSSEAKTEFKGTFTFSTSEDGENFQVQNSRYNTIKVYNRKEFQTLREKGIPAQSVLLLTRQHDRNGPVTARKVKITIETDDQPVFLDEIVVNPAK